MPLMVDAVSAAKETEVAPAEPVCVGARWPLSEYKKHAPLYEELYEALLLKVAWVAKGFNLSKNLDSKQVEIVVNNIFDYYHDYSVEDVVCVLHGLSARSLLVEGKRFYMPELYGKFDMDTVAQAFHLYVEARDFARQERVRKRQYEQDKADDRTAFWLKSTPPADELVKQYKTLCDLGYVYAAKRIIGYCEYHHPDLDLNETTND